MVPAMICILKTGFELSMAVVLVDEVVLLTVDAEDDVDVEDVFVLALVAVRASFGWAVGFSCVVTVLRVILLVSAGFSVDVSAGVSVVTLEAGASIGVASVL